ncbi:MAG: serine hydrolase domain-containing protein [Candidatus Limiplasma sp.]|nr:serine hydrolase domain-containing protein [Candidatus Limiplasma sp.]MEA5146450.1 serine hydrolase domain-containing protein [Candidatus Limiplasma sp.]
MNFARVDEIMRQAVLNHAFPAAALLVGQREKVLFRRAYGRLGYGEQEPATTEQTRFDIASLTKPLVVGTLALRAIESGKLCLWDKLGTFVDAPEDKRDITIRQLLTHTAGFPGGLHLWRMAEDPARATELLLGAKLQTPPGTRVRYCCAGFLLLGQLLECIYGQPLHDLALSEVFWPLKMTRTGYLPTGENIAPTELQADGTLLRGVVHDENARFLGGVAGNAGVFSTVDDLALYLQMLAGGGLLTDGTRYLTSATLRLAFQHHTAGLGQARGLGFYLPSHDDGYTGDLFPPDTVGHTGFTGSSFSLSPSDGFYLILLTNRVCPSRESGQIYRVRRIVHNAVFAARG